MADFGDKHKSGGHTRTYCNTKYDSIRNDSTGEYTWRDKEEHRTYKHDASLGNLFGFFNGCIGEEVDEYNSVGEDNCWDDDDDDSDDDDEYEDD